MNELEYNVADMARAIRLRRRSGCSRCLGYTCCQASLYSMGAQWTPWSGHQRRSSTSQTSCVAQSKARIGRWIESRQSRKGDVCKSKSEPPEHSERKGRQMKHTQGGLAGL